MIAVFCDNTVFCNFATVARVDLLESILRGRGCWTQAVAYEVERSCDYLPDLEKVLRGGWLGDPIEVSDEAEALLIERVRRAVFGGDPAKPHQHLGEAQTIHVIRTRAEFAGGWWISDDSDAVRYGRQQGLVTKETADLMAEAVAMADVTAIDGFDLLREMVARGRRLRVPGKASDLKK